MIQITRSANLNKLNNTNDYKIKPIFIIGVPRCGSTLVEKIIASGIKSIPTGEEIGVISTFVKKKLIKKESLNLGIEDFQIKIFEMYKQKKLINKKKNGEKKC